MEERISKLEDRNIEMIRVEEEREDILKMRKFYGCYLTLLGRATLGNGISEEEREKGAKGLSTEIIAENFPNLEKKTGATTL